MKANAPRAIMTTTITVTYLLANSMNLITSLYNIGKIFDYYYINEY